MKQTNNAIKFLMAQYRAIFRNANLKMFLAAATAAAALAAGQANAALPGPGADSTDLTDDKLKADFDAITGQDSVIIVVDGAGSKNDGTYKNMTISGAAADSGTQYDGKRFTLKLTSGTHTIDGKATEGKLSANSGSIVLDGNSNVTDIANNKLTIGGTTDISVSVENVDVKKGTLVISKAAADKSSVLNAGVITIGNVEASNDDIIAKATVLKSGSLGGADTKSITILKGGELSLGDASADVVSKSGVLLSGGKITVGDSNASGAGAISGGLVVESGVVTLGNGSNKGELTVENGNAHFKGNASFDNAIADSKLIVNGDAIFEKGSIKANSGSVSFGTLDSNKSQTLTIDAADWTKFFEGKGVAFTGRDATSVVKIDVKNATAEQPIDLATVVKADDGTFATAGGNKITVTTAGKAKIYADHAKFTAGEKLAASSGSFNFGSFEVVGKSAGDGKPYTFTIDGTDVSVTNQLKAVNPKSVIAVAASTGKSELTLGNANTTSGKLVNIEKVNVSGASAGADKNVLNINGKWDFGGARLNVGGNGTANINAGAVITNVERLQVGANPTEINIMGTANIARLLGSEGSDPAGNINVMTGGHLNIFGDGKAETKNPDNNKYANDVQLTTAKLNINAGGTVALVNKDAWDDVLEVSTDSTTGLSTFIVHSDAGNTTDFGGWKKENVALNGGTLRIDLTGYKVKDKAAVDALVGALASEATKGKGLFDFLVDPNILEQSGL